jgi:hypothetical protein
MRIDERPRFEIEHHETSGWSSISCDVDHWNGGIDAAVGEGAPPR